MVINWIWLCALGTPPFPKLLIMHYRISAYAFKEISCFMHSFAIMSSDLGWQSLLPKKTSIRGEQPINKAMCAMRLPYITLFFCQSTLLISLYGVWGCNSVLWFLFTQFSDAIAGNTWNTDGYKITYPVKEKETGL